MSAKTVKVQKRNIKDKTIDYLRRVTTMDLQAARLQNELQALEERNWQITQEEAEERDRNSLYGPRVQRVNNKPRKSHNQLTEN